MTNVIQFPRGAGYFRQDELQDIQLIIEAKEIYDKAHSYADAQVLENLSWFSKYLCSKGLQATTDSKYRDQYIKELKTYCKDPQIKLKFNLYVGVMKNVSNLVLYELHWLSQVRAGVYLTPEQIRATVLIKEQLEIIYGQQGEE